MKLVVFLFLLVLTGNAMAQSKLQTAAGVQKRVNPNYNRPKVVGVDCKALGADPRVWVREYCAQVDFGIQDLQSRLYGYPRPSPVVLAIPALGTAEAKAAGVYCADNRVLRKEGNAWVQAVDSQRRYLRCTPSVDLPAISIGR